MFEPWGMTGPRPELAHAQAAALALAVVCLASMHDKVCNLADICLAALNELNEAG